jgi:hypothetical protein
MLVTQDPKPTFSGRTRTGSASGFGIATAVAQQKRGNSSAASAGGRIDRVLGPSLRPAQPDPYDFIAAIARDARMTLSGDKDEKIFEV